MVWPVSVSTTVTTFECPSHLFRGSGVGLYRGTSLIRNNPTLGPYSRTIPRVLWWSGGGGLFLMSEVPL